MFLDREAFISIFQGKQILCKICQEAWGERVIRAVLARLWLMKLLEGEVNITKSD